MKGRLIRFTFLLILLVAGLAGGVVFDRQVLAAYVPPATVPADAAPGYKLISEAWNAIERSYVDQTAVDAQRLTYGAIGGMVSALGDTGHSRFLTPEMAKAQHDYNSGQFEGIGAYVEMKDGHTVIVAPIDNSPAQQAGLQPGDIIVAVDGQDVSSMALPDVAQLVLGPAGSPVTLTILDPKTGDTRDVTVVRAHLQLQNVTWQQLPDTTIAHLRIAAFSEGVSDDLQQALADMSGQGMTGIILDLRNNPGGLLNEAVGVASQFLPAGSNVLLRQNAQGEVKAEPVQPHSQSFRPTTLPMIVLVNQGSASASEVVAGALQDNGRAQLLGETTFGTGTVLEEFSLTDGSVLLLATEEWLTPDGRLIWHEGIQPDVVVGMADSVQSLLPLSERTLTRTELEDSGDIQLLQALDLLAARVDRFNGVKLSEVYYGYSPKC